MSCAREELTALCDGALDAEARRRVEEHLAGCAACRAERARIERALALLARLPPAPEPSPTFEQRFLARLARERSEGGLRRRLRWRLLVPLAAGAAAAVAVGVGLRERRQEELLAAHLDLLESYEAVASIGDVADGDEAVVAHLHQLEGRP
jgi:anti-sigma factor RsiW